MCPLLVPVLIGFFFAAAVNSTNEANKAGSTCHSEGYAVKQATAVATNVGLGRKFFHSFWRNTQAYFH